MIVQDCEVVSADAPSQDREQRGQELPTPKAGKGFPRAARLPKHSDFDRVYKQGRRHFSPHMTVFYLAQPLGLSRQNPARVGFTVGRALGGAVERNRIKRRLREAVRLRRAALPDGLDIVINPKKSVLALQFATVLDEVGRAFDAIAKAPGKRTMNK